MGEIFLNDKSVFPDDELVFSIIGDKELLWKQAFTCLFGNHKDITVQWK
ncbi:MAG: hypothetical protein JXB00_01525 [Bacteroidales bacterium]|nr:hypothetical protein [Bacteroidales bacterium]